MVVAPMMNARTAPTILSLALLGLTFSGCTAAPLGIADAGARRLPDLPDRAVEKGLLYSMHDACFDVTVTIPGSSIALPIAAQSVDVTMTGTLFLSRNTQNDARLVLIIPGGGSNRSFLDGGDSAWGRENHSTIPRSLARAGYVVVALERIGFPASPYAGPGGGSALTTDVQVEAIAGVVESLRSGSFTVGNQGCPGGVHSGLKFPSIILAGHSIGGLFAMELVLNGAHIDGLIPMAVHHQGVGPYFAPWVTGCSAIRPARPGYTHFFCDQPHPQLTCGAMLLNGASGAASRTREAMCNELFRAEDPGGEGDVPLTLARFHSRNQRIEALPIFLVHAERDQMVDPSLDALLAEKTAWERLCSCPVDYTILEGAGHNFMFEHDYKKSSERIIAWLSKEGLGATTA
jgi:pimeloyl-ACP methyl ester carboxylesterase